MLQMLEGFGKTLPEVSGIQCKDYISKIKVSGEESFII